MISVVICSVNKALAAQVKRNIDTTIGVPWELILIDNSLLKKGITEVYNLGGSSAKFDIICFVHEDVIFKTENWGSRVIDYFIRDPRIGLIALAGAKYKSRAPSGWMTGLKEYDCCNIIHTDKHGNVQRIYMNPDHSKLLQETVTADGVFLCTTKKVWQQHPFNEKLLKGFHLYDIDFSFAISRQYKVIVTYEIELDHITSGGDFGDPWLNYTILWHKENHQLLPASVNNLSGDNIEHTERKIKKNWLNRLKGEPIKYSNRVRWLMLNNSFTDPRLWSYTLLFLLFRTLRKQR